MTPRQRVLRLEEELLLLALHETKGTIVSAAHNYPFALSGGLLAELLLAERIAVTPDKKQLVSVSNSQPLGQPLLDECLGQLATAKHPQSLKAWVGRLAQLRRLKHRVAEALCDRGVLREDEASFLLFFSRRVYPTSDARWRTDLQERLRRSFSAEGHNLDRRTLIRLSLAYHTRVLWGVFDRAELKERGPWFKQYLGGELFGAAAHAAIAAGAAAHGAG